MREFVIGKNDAGQRLDRFVAKNMPLLPPALLQKYIRLKRIKVNGKGSKRDVRLETGDTLQLYINDEFFDKPSTRMKRRRSTPSLTTFRLIYTKRKNGIPSGRTLLPRPCATALTAIPAESSSPPKAPRPCA